MSRSALYCLTTLLIVCATATTQAGAVSNGRPGTVEEVPWQVAVKSAAASCSGVIIDPTRVLTAAHCADDGQPLQVIAGTSDAAAPPRDAQKRAVSAVALHPYYTGEKDLHDDIAVLQLASPLTATPRVQAIPLIAPGAKLPAGTPLTLSGYGEVPPARSNSVLHIGATVANGAEQCPVSGQNASAVWLCSPSAAEFARSCPGDSGGPLTTVPPGAPGPVLAGLVSHGSQPDCAFSFSVGVDLAAPEIRAFIDGNPAPPRAPALARDFRSVRLGSANQAGKVLTCDAPDITGDPQLTYVFAHQPGDADPTRVIPRTVVQAGRSPRHALTVDDVGKHMVCILEARNAGGLSSWATDDQSELRLAVRRSRTRPDVRIRSASCQARRCTVKFRIRERRSAAGWRRVAARIGRTKLAVKRQGRGRYRATGRSSKGARTVRVSAVSAASGRRDVAVRRLR